MCDRIMLVYFKIDQNIVLLKTEKLKNKLRRL